MPPSVALQLEAAGGFWAAMVAVVPALATAGYLRRLSTSAGLRRTDTGEEFPGSGGLHVYVTIKDGTDAVRFLKTLHARCWLAGFGWMVVGKAGQLLERSIIDRMVGAAERLVFEGPPELVPPLRQDAAARKPTVVTGDVVDSIAACPPLSIVEQQRFDQLKAQARLALAGECAAKRAAWIASRAAEMVARTGMTVAEAAGGAGEAGGRVAAVSVELEFDDPDLAGTTVGDVLDDPAKYAGETLADPIEGVEDGPCKAQGDDRTATGCRSSTRFAHGHTDLPAELRRERGACAACARGRPMWSPSWSGWSAWPSSTRSSRRRWFTKWRGAAASVCATSGRLLKAAAKERSARRSAAARERAKAERSDPRPQMARPAPDAAWLPVIGALDAVADAASLLRRPRRDIDGTLMRERRMPISQTHAFTSANDEEDDDDRPASS